MRKFTLLVLAKLFMVIGFASAQEKRVVDMGIIEVNENNTATLFFPDVIYVNVVANNPVEGEGYKYYDIFQDGKICVIRGNRSDAPETSITIYLENERIYFGKLRFGKDARILYNFGEEIIPLSSEFEEKKKVEKETIRTEAMEEERLTRLMKEKIEYNVYGSRESGVEFLVSNIKNDEANSYFKIIISNNTGGDYVIDGILFKFIEGKRRGAKRKEAKIEERIMHKKILGPEVASAYSKIEIGVIIPLFSVGNTGDLIIQVREKNGTRNPKIRISGKDMLKVKVF
jgi:hypothetical protein